MGYDERLAPPVRRSDPADLCTFLVRSPDGQLFLCGRAVFFLTLQPDAQHRPDVSNYFPNAHLRLASALAGRPSPSQQAAKASHKQTHNHPL